MKITRLFEQGVFVVTSEVGPIKGAVSRDKTIHPTCAREAMFLQHNVHAVNVTDNQSAVMRLGSLAASVLLKDKGIESVYQLTCRDRNRIALQSDLLTAYSLGIDNVLLLTGDHIQLGDHKEAKPVFDLDSVQLLHMAMGLRNGYDITGHPIENPPDMAYGAVVNPNFDPIELQLIKMRKKVDAGAEFFQTQAVYDEAVFDRFIDKAAVMGRPIQLGVVVLKSPQMGKYMNQNVSGIMVPQSWIDEIGSVDKADRKKKAAEMTGRLVRKLKDRVQGVHIMPLGWTDVVPDILAHAGIEVKRLAFAA
ncbi:methylenetetrahydrofolate reductase [Desulfatirhabdium butyrativorans]|uniref:methylenetetrahydrofolate reductase n=1 Tax=Desulfatirhabdium butyrativorans TaxID=340467 RepID=UPI000410B6C1|nr:methylenetetrahydrofolate reductase [Desulfatirhabdium butyrativorans]